jgi:hypothetical protein
MSAPNRSEYNSLFLDLFIKNYLLKKLNFSIFKKYFNYLKIIKYNLNKNINLFMISFF